MRLLSTIGIGLILGYTLLLTSLVLSQKIDRALSAKTVAAEQRLQQLNHEFQIRADVQLAHRLGITGF